MDRINLADAKAHLSELVTRASEGDEIEIVRRGKTVARLVPPARPKRGIDVDELRRMTDGMTYQEQSAGESIRAMRDSDRY